MAQALVGEIRDGDAPYPILVGGLAADFVDQQDAIGSNLPLAIALLVGLTFAVLWLMTGSLILPLKAIVMNALTVGSSLGVLTLIFQEGRFESLLGYTANGGIEPTDFLVASALVFALSTDYGVFLLGRIKEAREAGLRDREAVAIGVERTGAVRDGRGDPARGRDRLVRHVVDLVHPADRHRDGGGRAHRRLRRARAARARADGAARQVELVVAARRSPACTGASASARGPPGSRGGPRGRSWSQRNAARSWSPRRTIESCH